MKGFVLWVLGTTMIFLSFSTQGSTSSVPDMALTGYGDGMVARARNRKLKNLQDNGYASSSSAGKSDAGSMTLEDYHPIDPVPNSKASVRPGPIQHGTPLMPFIPKPSPPDHPKHGGFP